MTEPHETGRRLRHRQPPTTRRALLAAALLTATWCAGQTGLTITFLDGGEQGYQIEESGKLAFSADELLLATNDQVTPTNIPLSAIRKITFGAATGTGIEQALQRSNHVLFPNPTSNSFTIGGLTAPAFVRILTLAGQEVLTGRFGNGETVSVEHLSPGIYIVSIDHIPSKLIKQ